ncbi:hypothetical protein HanRHA438_Chr02g0091811 [Helianthus annuus]|nr:hypothetical protein HanHA300_Chr02g0067451 [Helianthus annuus]KAJ0619837.1 hypothetical protein HanHA89_Chr02g0075731 [Helianthus annuus]KAJ0941197.1 hypothetical protein HanRHA438_Chr02g0091811 [Helianthus annuus]KAJ0952935.1 hypothetical protein HanPSC8_Chr02g0078101 [Helianthus annuus]
MTLELLSRKLITKAFRLRSRNHFLRTDWRRWISSKFSLIPTPLLLNCHNQRHMTRFRNNSSHCFQLHNRITTYYIKTILISVTPIQLLSKNISISCI